MKPSYPLTEYEKHIVRETPELGWDADTAAEAHDEKPLPIDLAYGLSDDPVTWQEMSPACWVALIGLAVAIVGAVAILWVVL